MGRARFIVGEVKHHGLGDATVPRFTAQADGRKSQIVVLLNRSESLSGSPPFPNKADRTTCVSSTTPNHSPMFGFCRLRRSRREAAISASISSIVNLSRPRRFASSWISVNHSGTGTAMLLMWSSMLTFTVPHEDLLSSRRVSSPRFKGSARLGELGEGLVPFHVHARIASPGATVAHFRPSPRLVINPIGVQGNETGLNRSSRSWQRKQF